MSASKARHLVFVYGTLKRGEPNHHWLSDPATGQSRAARAALAVTVEPGSYKQGPAHTEATR